MDSNFTSTEDTPKEKALKQMIAELRKDLDEQRRIADDLLDHDTIKVKNLTMEVADKDKLLEDQEKLLAEKDVLLAEKDVLLDAKDRLLAEKDVLLDAKNQLLADKNVLLDAKNRLLEDKDVLLATKDRFLEREKKRHEAQCSLEFRKSSRMREENNDLKDKYQRLRASFPRNDRNQARRG